MSDVDVLDLRIHLTRLAERLSAPRTEREPGELAWLLQAVRDEAEAALAVLGVR